LTDKLAQELSKAYQDRVAVKYVDVDKEGLDKYPLMNKVLRMGYSYPITIINGRPRFAGAIMSAEIKKCIEEIIAQEGTAG
jgi:disulfide oxidoreductase YuzD